MTDIQAALGLTQLKRYESFLKRRRRIAEVYFGRLAGLPITLPYELLDRSIFFRFPIRTDFAFDELRAAFDREGVQVRQGVDALLHRFVGLNPAEFPEAERKYAETVSLPLYPALSDQMLDRVIEIAHRVFRHGS
jgi:perosamine synthetase